MSSTVYSKDELKEAIKNQAFPITVKGRYAKELIEKLHKRKRVTKGAAVIGGLGAVASAFAIPFTGGVSAAGVAAGISAAGLTVSAATIAVSLTVGQLAVLCGFSLGALGIVGGLLTNRKVKVKYGKTEVEISEKV